MGANIQINESENRVHIVGNERVYGRNVKSKDLRGGASLVIEGLIAEEITVVNYAEYILRGYEKFDQKLRSLGADIKLIKEWLFYEKSNKREKNS